VSVYINKSIVRGTKMSEVTRHVPACLDGVPSPSVPGRFVKTGRLADGLLVGSVQPMTRDGPFAFVSVRSA
jgi:hypothetical protein